jgi:hypothetical protein
MLNSTQLVSLKVSQKQKQNIKYNMQKKSGFKPKKTEIEKNEINLLKTDRRSVFGLLKTVRFLFRSRFPAGL